LESDPGTAEKPLINVMLVEDHASFREALAFMLEREPGLKVVRQAGSLAEAREDLQGVDLALVDLALPDGDGVELIRELRAANPQGMVLVLSGGLDLRQSARAVEAGASGLVHKMSGLDEILEAIRRLRSGKALLSQEEVVELLRAYIELTERDHRAQLAISRLTAREKEVLQALADGLDSEGVARRLHISVETERSHMANVLRKLGVHSRMEAVLFAARYGVVTID
jgi:DNA-binding NarL/FixJ family response regulator